MAELLEIARTKATSKERALVVSDMPDTPYRCIGEAVFTLQRAGFRNVVFDAKAAETQK